MRNAARRLMPLVLESFRISAVIFFRSFLGSIWFLDPRSQGWRVLCAGSFPRKMFEQSAINLALEKG
jgi:hypothetical protein